jgi:Uma2 family endonuclease
MGIADKIIPHYTYEDYVHWEGRWELIEGHPIAMSPLPVPEHQRVASEIRTEFTIALRNAACENCHAYDPLDYKIDDDTILNPDILIVCGKIGKKYLDFPPVLVVEILSPSTTLRDRNTKYLIYEQQLVKYYLIVDADKKNFEIYQLIDGKYQLQQFVNSFDFQLSNTCIIAPALAHIWP